MFDITLNILRTKLKERVHISGDIFKGRFAQSLLTAISFIKKDGSSTNGT